VAEAGGAEVDARGLRQAQQAPRARVHGKHRLRRPKGARGAQSPPTAADHWGYKAEAVPGQTAARATAAGKRRCDQRSGSMRRLVGLR
jgi:hypothetical protein